MKKNDFIKKVAKNEVISQYINRSGGDCAGRRSGWGIHGQSLAKRAASAAGRRINRHRIKRPG